MKNILTILGLALLTSFTISAQTQQKSGKLNTTTNKTFTIERDGTETQYNVKIMEHRNYPIKWEKEDKGMVDQDREYEAAKVTKLIAIDKDHDNRYDQYFAISYRRSVTDNFELMATDNGFAIRINDHLLKLREGKSSYFIVDSGQDFFMVEEFRKLG